MATAKEFVAVAEQYVGYKEKKTLSHLNCKACNAGHANYNRFARDLKNNGWSWLWQKSAWCCEFVCACSAEAVNWNKTKAQKLFGGTAEMSCTRLWNQMKKAGKKMGKRTSFTPQMGDYIFFQNSGGICHIGLVTKVTSTRVYTIEGNSGDMVKRKDYSLTSTYIYGYARPGWDAETPAEPKGTTTFTYKRGVDLSSWDVTSHKTHTDKVLESKYCDIVIVKFTEGINYKNPYRLNQYAGAKKGKKLLGTYHYANGGDAKKEAAYYYKAVKDTIGEAIPFLDWEGGGNKVFNKAKATRRAWIKAFLDEFERLSGVRPGVYVQLSRIDDAVGLTDLLWGAGYPQAGWDKWTLPTYIYAGYIAMKKLAIWQFTSAGGTDRNIIFISDEQWAAAATPKVPQVPKPATTVKASRTYQSLVGLNVRTGPDTSYKAVDFKPKGAKFSSNVFKRDAKGRSWREIEYSPGKKGWICIGKSGDWYVKRLK